MQERHGWVLTTFGQRLAAYALDCVLVYLPFAVCLATYAIGLALQLTYRPEDDGNSIFTLLPYFLVGSFALSVGSGIWWLFALGRGQTPGKQLVGIRVIRVNGERSNWCRMFVRESVVKGLACASYSAITIVLPNIGVYVVDNRVFILIGITASAYWLADHLWPLFDKDSQAIHDKIARTLVVRNRR